MRESGDRGAPITAAAPETPLAKAFVAAARAMAAQISIRTLAGADAGVKVSF